MIAFEINMLKNWVERFTAQLDEIATFLLISCLNFQSNQDSFLGGFWLGMFSLKNAEHLKKI